MYGIHGGTPAHKSLLRSHEFFFGRPVFENRHYIFILSDLVQRDEKKVLKRNNALPLYYWGAECHETYDFCRQFNKNYNDKTTCMCTNLLIGMFLTYYSEMLYFFALFRCHISSNHPITNAAFLIYAILNECISSP